MFDVADDDESFDLNVVDVLDVVDDDEMKITETVDRAKFDDLSVRKKMFVCNNVAVRHYQQYHYHRC